MLWFCFSLFLACHMLSAKNASPQRDIVRIPEAHMSVCEMLKFHGYPCESHEIHTEDGYILTLFRIPHGKYNQSKTSRKNSVLLVHGLMDSASTWVINLPHQSLGYILADKGFDVWLGNIRGNTYSKRHLNYSKKSNRFWDFSFEEMAKYDLPAMIKYIKYTTNDNDLHYIGHSQGTLLGFIEFSRNEELAKKVKTFVALGPVTHVRYVKGVLRLLAIASKPIQLILKTLGIREFLPTSLLTKFLGRFVCGAKEFQPVCACFIFLIAGYNTKNLNKTRIPVYISHTPAGTSVKNVAHFSQMVQSGKFRKYDHGLLKNLLRYGSFTPPSYDVTSMSVPVALFSGSNDWLATSRDIRESLRPKLKHVIHDEEISDWNHLDFIWGKDAHKRIYGKVVNLLQK